MYTTKLNIRMTYTEDQIPSPTPHPPPPTCTQTHPPAIELEKKFVNHLKLNQLVGRESLSKDNCDGRMLFVVVVFLIIIYIYIF